MLVGTCNKDYDNENVVQDKIDHYMHSSTSQQLVSPMVHDMPYRGHDPPHELKENGKMKPGDHVSMGPIASQ